MSLFQNFNAPHKDFKEFMYLKHFNRDCGMRLKLEIVFSLSVLMFISECQIEASHWPVKLIIFLLLVIKLMGLNIFACLTRIRMDTFRGIFYFPTGDKKITTVNIC